MVSSMPKVSRCLYAVLNVAVRPNDTPEERLRKSVLTLFGLFIFFGSPFDLINSIDTKDSVGIASLLFYMTLTAVGFAHFIISGSRTLFQRSQFFLILCVLTTYWIINGGFLATKGNFIWAALVPFGALLLTSRKEAIVWLALYFVASDIIMAFDWNSLPDDAEISNLYFKINLFYFFPVTVFILVFYFVTKLEQTKSELQKSNHQLQDERQKSERLLLNILPRPIAKRLKDNQQIIADHFADVTVLFADIVGFTSFSSQTTPEKTVFLLNHIFSAFDDLAERYSIEKIKTIGDAYMGATGLPRKQEDHAEVMADFALAMLECLQEINQVHTQSFALRIGINSGPVVAGVIGKRKFIYDLWGDTVNTASRMESHGQPGSIQVTEATYLRLKDSYQFTKRGQLNIKGKGDMKTYFLVAPKKLL